MILVDTNVLVALVDERDDLRRRAQADLVGLAGETFAVAEAALGEALYLMPLAIARRKLRRLLDELKAEAVGVENWGDVFDWMERYAEHRPDWADAVQVVVTGVRPAARVWTYDREFRTVWRRADGSAVPMAVE